MLPATTNSSASATSHFHPAFVSAVNGTADNFIPSLYTKSVVSTTGAANVPLLIVNIAVNVSGVSSTAPSTTILV